jgi:arylsulfatase A-like enzyme
MLRGGAEPERNGVLLEFGTETRSGRGYYDATWRAIRTRRHKYSVLGDRSGSLPWQLFDLQEDPFEQVNLLDRPNLGDLAGDLHGRLAALLRESADDYALAPAFGHPGQACVAP